MSESNGSKKKEAKTPALISLMAGGIAGGVEGAATYPFEFAKTRVQLSSERGPKNPFTVVTTVYREEGLKAMYKGCSTLILGSVGKDAIRFLSFDTIKSMFADPETGNLSPLRSLFSGMCAGVVASTFAVTPSERIKTALIDDARSKTNRFTGPLQASKLLVQEKGLKALYAGYTTTTLKQIGTTSARMGSYSILKDYEVSKGVKQTTLMNFVNGAIAGTVTTFATQPFDVVKTRAQSVKGARTIEATMQIWNKDGLRGFWRGTVMRLGRTVVAGGILFTTNEKATVLLKTLMQGKTPM